MKLAIRPLLGLVAFCLGVLAVSSCGRASSVQPTSPSLATDAQRVRSKFAPTSQDALSHPLLGGSVVIKTRKGIESPERIPGRQCSLRAAARRRRSRFRCRTGQVPSAVPLAPSRFKVSARLPTKENFLSKDAVSSRSREDAVPLSSSVSTASPGRPAAAARGLRSRRPPMGRWRVSAA